MLGLKTSKTDLYPRLYPLFTYDTNTETFLTLGQPSHMGLVRAKSVQFKPNPALRSGQEASLGEAPLKRSETPSRPKRRKWDQGSERPFLGPA